MNSTQGLSYETEFKSDMNNFQNAAMTTDKLRGHDCSLQFIVCVAFP